MTTVRTSKKTLPHLNYEGESKSKGNLSVGAAIALQNPAVVSVTTY